MYRSYTCILTILGSWSPIEIWTTDRPVGPSRFSGVGGFELRIGAALLQGWRFSRTQIGHGGFGIQEFANGS